MQKISFFEIKEEEKQFFSKYIKADFFSGTLNEELKENQYEYEVVSVFINSKIDNEILYKLPKLKYIQTRSTGYDHLKCKLLYKQNILVSNVAGYGSYAVGEFTFSLLLNYTRKTYIALDRTKKNNFEYKDLKGIELFDKTIGILGLGNIGGHIAKIAKGFGMNILAYSRSNKSGVELELLNLDEVISKSDILILALPLTPKTKYILNQKNIKDNMIIVNIGRAELIEKSLYNRENIFCLDVIQDTKYISQNNILYTPHMAYYTQEALQRIMNISLENLKAYLDNKSLPNCLHLECEKNC